MYMRSEGSSAVECPRIYECLL